MARPKFIGFDCFGTLCSNAYSEWDVTINDIVREQGLGIDGATLHKEWRKFESQFRKTRTHMDNPAGSPPFRTYWEAWRDAFVSVFSTLGITGDADAAATRCVDDHCRREAFPDAKPAIEALKGVVPMGVMSNADNRFLDGSLAFNGWTFDAVVSSEHAKAYKPDPRAFEALLSVAGVAPEDVLYVGDSAYDDVHGAKLVGMRTVLIRRDQPTPGRTPTPEDAQLLAPDFEIRALTELAGLLDPLA